MKSCHNNFRFSPGVLAEEAQCLRAVLIYYSTDYVFDGALGRPHVEMEPPNPLTLYGRSKLAGGENISAVGGDVSYPAHPLGLEHGQ